MTPRHPNLVRQDASSVRSIYGFVCGVSHWARSGSFRRRRAGLSHTTPRYGSGRVTTGRTSTHLPSPLRLSHD